MGAIASQITSLTIVYSTVYSDADQWKHQSSASLAFVRGIHRGPVNSPHKWPVTRKMFPFDDVIMYKYALQTTSHYVNRYKLRSARYMTSFDHSEFRNEEVQRHCWTHQGLNKIAVTLQTAFQEHFLERDIYPLIQISLNVVSKGLIDKKSHNFSRLWLVLNRRRIHYLNQWWNSSLTHICDSKALLS